ATVAGLEEAAVGPSPVPPAAAPAGVAPAAGEAGASPEQPSSGGREEVTETGEPATRPPHPGVPFGAESGSAAACGLALDRAARRRQAISRALVAHGYLVFTRRRIPPPIRKKKVT